MKGPGIVGILLAASLVVVGVRTVHAAQSVAASGQARRVDDDDRDGGGWFPLWFGFHFFVPRPPVIIGRPYYPERNDYPATPPPPPLQTYYYFCQSPEGYYPQVPDCPGGWLRVLPSGGPLP